MTTTDRLDDIVRVIRACFGKLRAAGDELHRDIGITAAMRAVMEFIADREATVPDIARAKLVSRQNIQVLVDALLTAGLVELHENPAHKRSPFAALTQRGRTTFRDMRRREAAVLSSVASSLSPEAMATTLATLNKLNGRLDVLARGTQPAGADND